MTKEEFRSLPYLLTPGQVALCGYAPATLNKYAENGILQVVLPAGVVRQRRFKKRQIAQLLGWEDTLDWTRWRKEKPLLASCAVREWTGYSEVALRHIVAEGGLLAVKPGGIGDAKYRKEEIGAWIGF